MQEHHRGPDISDRHSRAFLLAYGCGSIGTAAFFVVPQLFLLYMSTEFLGIPAFWAGIAMFLPRVWEFLIDPFIGRISDSWSGRWGRRRPFLVFGALLFSVTFVALFSPPDAENWILDFVHLLLAYLLCTTAFAIFAVPYLSVPAEITSDPDERTRIVAYRMAGSSVGLVLAGIAGPLVLQAFGEGLSGYRAMAIALALPISFCMLMPAFALRNVSEGDLQVPLHNAGESARRIISNRAFLTVAAVFFLQTVASGASLALLPYFNAFSLGAETANVSFLYAFLTLGMFSALPVWLWLSRTIGKARSYMISILAYAVASACLIMAPSVNMPLNALLFTFVGSALGGTQLLAFSLFPDTLTKDGTGQAYEGLFTGVWISIDSLGVALGALIAGSVLQFSTYDSALQLQTPETASTITLAMTFGISLLLVPAGVFAWRMQRQMPG